MLQPAPTEEDIEAAYLCQSGANIGQPHQWTYLRGIHKLYKCAVCLVVITKARLKELTDNA